MTKKRTRISVATDEVLVVKKRGEAISLWCAQCAAAVQMVTPEVAASIAGVTSRTIYRWVESGLIHFVETPDGALLVCLRSL